MRSLKTSYLLMVPVFFGIAGLHRFYLNKIGTGILWLCTFGLFGIGSIYDAATMARQLRDKDEEETGEYHNIADYWAQISNPESDRFLRENRIMRRLGYPGEGFNGQQAPSASGETQEHRALRLAKQNGGFVTPSQLALDANMAADDAKAILDDLSARGYADVRIRRNGLVAYVFPDFLTPEVESQFETI